MRQNLRYRPMLPKIYGAILPESFHNLWLEEKLDCQTCEMACGASALYSADLKCCTYRPYLANYLVGDLLAQDGEVAALLRRQIAEREFATPMGLIAPEAYQMAFTYKSAEDYGRSKDLLCPYYDRGRCQVWSSRSSECLQFHCRSSYGDQGLAFWKAFGESLYDIEILCAQRAMLHKGFDWEEVEDISEMIKIKKFSVDSEGRHCLRPDEYRELWQHQFSSIEQYFKECYEFVSTDPSLKADVAEFVAGQTQLFERHEQIVKEVKK